VLHLFQRVVNLVDEEGAVLTLAAPEVPLTPLAWRVEGGVIRRCAAEMPVAVVADGVLRLGPMRLSAADVPLWNARPPWEALRDRREELLAHGAELAHDPILAHRLEQATDAVLAAQPPPRSTVGGRRSPLAGLGSGLTPAGDDILMGILHALHAWRPDTDLCRRLAAAAAPHTTTLSAALLRAAAAGEASEPWHRLCAGAPGAVAAIQAAGHTSGRDAWYGFVRAAARLRAPGTE
jgi:hypothetical protein